jgi:hypothetical protein
MNGMNSALGIAKQSAKGTPATTGFNWFLFNEGMAGPQERSTQLPPEAGGGILSRGLIRMGVSGAAGGQLIPRANSLGALLVGVMGKDTPTAMDPDTTPASGDEYTQHVLTFDTDMSAVPYWTIRRAVSNSFGELVTDAKVAGVSLEMAALNVVEGQFAMMGIEPALVEDISAWNPSPDGSPPFSAAKGVCKMATADTVSTLPVRAATLQIGNTLNVDKEFIIGSYFPRDVDLLTRAASVSFVVFVQDHEIYAKLAYDPAGGAAWLADVFSSAELDLEFNTLEYLGTAGTVPYGLKVSATKTQWTVRPIAVRANDIIVAQVSGMIVQPSAGEALTLTLSNTVDAY